jgi:hypothetical protein
MGYMKEMLLGGEQATGRRSEMGMDWRWDGDGFMLVMKNLELCQDEQEKFLERWQIPRAEHPPRFPPAPPVASSRGPCSLRRPRVLQSWQLGLVAWAHHIDARVCEQLYRSDDKWAVSAVRSCSRGHRDGLCRWAWSGSTACWRTAS